MSKPYKEIQISENKKLRFFHSDVLNESELEWHRDHNDRLVEVIEANGWSFQYDNELPIQLQEGDKLFIPKEHFHRVIKGNGDLVVEITENPSENVIEEAKVFDKRSVGEVDIQEQLKASDFKRELASIGYEAATELSPDEESGILNRFINKIIAYLNSRSIRDIEQDQSLKAAFNAIPETEKLIQPVEEAKGSTKGYLYEVVARMITDRNRNKSEIVNDLRAIKDVTVVSIIPGQNFALQRTKTREKTLIKIKFAPGASPIKKMQEIKASAFGRAAESDCAHPKIDGLVELDFKRETLKPIRTY
jgi:hypothetical protein